MASLAIAAVIALIWIFNVLPDSNESEQYPTVFQGPSTAELTTMPGILPNTNTASVAPPAAPEVFLDEVAEYQVVRGPGNFETGLYVVNGNTYTRSVAFPNPCGQYPEVVEFVSSRRFSKFTAVIGLADDSGSAAKVQFEVAADGVPVGGPYVMTLGKHEAISVSLSNPVKLKLTTTNVGGCNDYYVENATAVWGDAKLVR
ncbi:NPCBM/NEW2 domain-containing protein [Saccharothrix sp. ALI-22-I]|uniref:NPCBM/NEW2 domain-containing protein n=1 Tax=Saccharothrix sp. ALI-22-I TaxID=1933778 RepID=UPI00117B7FC7|nr:NPCBM/NEW2 domain-containing protein [Saccharothrix sp. ALI-22-I]